MKHIIIPFFILSLLVLLSSVVVSAEDGSSAPPPAVSVTVTVGVDKIPPVADDDALTVASVFVTQGQQAFGSGGVAVLKDGRLAAAPDVPEENYFFNTNRPNTNRSNTNRATTNRSNTNRANTNSQGNNRPCMIIADLRQTRSIRTIRTYSRHPAERLRQAYEISGGKESTDPNQPGRIQWELIATVDSDTAVKDAVNGTAPADAMAVTISSTSESGVIGQYRFLAFSISPATELPGENRRLSVYHTFYSEIDVLDGESHRRMKPAVPVVAESEQNVVPEIELDVSNAPESVKKWAEETLLPTCKEWYPKLVRMLPGDGFQAPRKCRIVFRPGQGVAYTSGTTITCLNPWFERNLDGEALGAAIHELTHVVQQYKHPVPTWLMEGLTDYIRWHVFEPGKDRSRIDFRRARVTDSYRTTARFLAFVVDQYDEDLVARLGQSLRSGDYADDYWTTTTGKTIDQLWSEFREKYESKP